MKNNKIRLEWEKFVDEYNKYFNTNKNTEQ